ncbi:hypothetical protein, partial [Candidatus Oleimmundimicrobium sp.]|uniref:hypothetical protein n=1 Tax=Candidatus Oleimmundimicrobium sp. TaxID=3060597 RepID=UPI002723F060
AELSPINRGSDSFGRNPALSIVRRRSHISPMNNPPGFKDLNLLKRSFVFSGSWRLVIACL